MAIDKRFEKKDKTLKLSVASSRYIHPILRVILNRIITTLDIDTTF